MNLFTVLLIAASLSHPKAADLQPESYLDSNTAFYAGENQHYIITPPDGFRMVEEEAEIDGYSMAFIPDSDQYLDASLFVGVNIYKIRGLDFADVMTQDTISLRDHFGETVELYALDSIYNDSRENLPTFYINDKSRFLPNVMISYYNGGTELIIFELVITEDVLRFKAEEAFMQVINRFRSLKIGDLSKK